ncbi:AMP-binding enzyme [Nocardia gipuzkoensis]
MPRGLVALGAGAEINPDQVQAELVQAVREQIGAVAALRTVHVVPGLPKTRSGNMLRKRYMASPTAETNPTLACRPVAQRSPRAVPQSGLGEAAVCRPRDGCSPHRADRPRRIGIPLKQRSNTIAPQAVPTTIAPNPARPCAVCS